MRGLKAQEPSGFCFFRGETSMAHHKVEHEKKGKKVHESKTGKLKIHGGFKAMEHEKTAMRKKG